MAGTVEGGKKAALKNLANNPNFYSEIGFKGGSVSTPTGGFASLTREQLIKVSRKGGKGNRKK